MTLEDVREVYCAVCGYKNTVMELRSTNTMEPPDLDMRPGEMLRSTMDLWVQRCPRCGYCASEIDKGDNSVSSVVESNPYREQLGNPDFTELANSFLCCAMLYEKAEEYGRAGIMAQNAAWSCDDQGLTNSAEECRLKAVRFLEEAWKRNQEFGTNKGNECVIVVDLLRRTGRFPQAQEMCEQGLAKIRYYESAALLEYEKALIEKSDSSCHSSGEVDIEKESEVWRKESEERKREEEEYLQSDDPNNPCRHFYNAEWARWFEGDPDKALSELEVALLLLNSLDKESKEFKIARENGITARIINLSMADILTDTGLYEEAIDRYRTAINLDAEDEFSHYGLARSCERLGMLEEAQGELEEAINLDPQWGAYHFLLSQVLKRRGNIDRSEEELEASLRLMLTFNDLYNPVPETDSVDRLLKIATYLRELDKDDEAMLRLDEALEIEPDFFIIHSMIGDIHYDKGDYEKALQEYQIVIDSFAPEFIETQGFMEQPEALESTELLEAHGIVDARYYLGKAMSRISKIESP